MQRTTPQMPLLMLLQGQREGVTGGDELCDEPEPAAPGVLGLDAVQLSRVGDSAAGRHIARAVQLQAWVMLCDGPRIPLILLAKPLQLCSALPAIPLCL